MFGTQPIYLVFKLVATIYERLVKAKQLVRTKVEEDLAKTETLEALGLADDSKETQSKLNDFKISAITERFSMLISSLIGTISVTQRLDSSNYEDIARHFMGSQAYLLFLFDKLVATVSLYLILTHFCIDVKAYPWLEDRRRLPQKSAPLQIVHKPEGLERTPLSHSIPVPNAVS